MKEVNREVLTPTRIKEDLSHEAQRNFWQSGVLSVVILLFCSYIVFLLLHTMDGVRSEYKALLGVPAVLVGLCALGTVAVLMLRAWKRKRMVREGQYEVLQDKLVNAVPSKSPYDAQVTDLYFEHYGPFRKPGRYKGNSYGIPYVVVIFKDQKGTLAKLYSLEKYRLASEEENA